MISRNDSDAVAPAADVRRIAQMNTADSDERMPRKGRAHSVFRPERRAPYHLGLRIVNLHRHVIGVPGVRLFSSKT